MIHIKIQEILDKKEKSAFWLAKECKVDYNNIKKLVANNNDSIKFSTLDKICDVLECDLSDIMERKKDS